MNMQGGVALQVLSLESENMLLEMERRDWQCATGTVVVQLRGHPSVPNLEESQCSAKMVWQCAKGGIVRVSRDRSSVRGTAGN